MRAIRSHATTNEQIDKMRAAFVILKKHMETKTRLDAIEETAKSMGLDNVDRNVLVECAKRVKK